MYDLSKLRGRVFEKYGSIKNFAEHIGKDNCYMSKVFSGKARLTQEQIDLFARELEIAPEDIGTYFFTLKVRT